MNKSVAAMMYKSCVYSNLFVLLFMIGCCASAILPGKLIISTRISSIFSILVLALLRKEANEETFIPLFVIFYNKFALLLVNMR